MATSIDQSNYVKTALRLPPELHAAVHESAQKNGRSYNAELVTLIERALSVPDGFIRAPERMMYLEENQSEPRTRTGKEMMIELADLLDRASHMAQIFRSFQDGSWDEAAQVDLSNPPDWVDDHDSKPAKRRVVRKRVIK